MKHFRLIVGLVLIPIGAFLGSFVPIGTGSGIILGFVVGIALSYLFLIYGPGHKKNQLPTSYYLNHDQHLNPQLDGLLHSRGERPVDDIPQDGDFSSRT